MEKHREEGGFADCLLWSGYLALLKAGLVQYLRCPVCVALTQSFGAPPILAGFEKVLPKTPSAPEYPVSNLRTEEGDAKLEASFDDAGLPTERTAYQIWEDRRARLLAYSIYV